MKRIVYLAAVILFVISSTVFAKTVRVKGGLTKSGSYKMPSCRTSPNKTKLDNWSTKGNVNPYTGKKGTADPFGFKLNPGK
ncbi:MAG: hypothetical protein V1933_00525 [Candidatus Omnitrophota bacterium]